MSFTSQRLEQLAKDAGVCVSEESRPSLSRDYVSFIKDGDKEFAENLLRKNRQDAFLSKSHVFRRQPSKSGFKHDEIYAAMESIVRNHGIPGVVECLLEKSNGAKLDKRSFFKNRGNLTVEKINPLLTLAAETRQPNMVHLLSQHSDQSGLDTALGITISKCDRDSTKILLQNGANPNSVQEGFQEAVGSGDTQLVELLLSSEKDMEIPFIDRMLPNAVSRGFLDIVVLLLEHGANADFEQALESAVSNSRADITAALVMARRPPSQASLDRAIGLIIFDSTEKGDAQKNMIETLLCAGAKGETVKKGLVKAVERNDDQLVSLILGYGSPASLDPSDAILCAITLGNYQLLDHLLEVPISAEQASRILWVLPTIASELPASRRLHISHALVRHGACGDSLSRFLIDAVQNGDSEIVEYLIENGASADYDDAQALRYAILACSISDFRLLMRAKPSQISLEQCFLLLDDSPYDARLEMTRELLAAGAKGQMIDNALRRLVSSEFTYETESLIEELIRHGADVNVDDGACFQEASRTGNLPLLNLLLRGKPAPTSIARGIPSAMKLSNSNVRFTVLDLLLTSGAKGPQVDYALLELVDESPADIALIKEFLNKGNANVNIGDGKPIYRATKYGNLELLKVLLLYQPSIQNLNTVFPSAVALSDLDLQYAICQRLLTAGACGEAVDAALITVQRSQTSHSLLLDLLLEHGANINFKNGSVLRWAIRGSDYRQLGKLISNSPSADTLRMALDLIVMVDTTRRNEMGRIVLEAGCAENSEAVNKALADAVKLNRDLSFIQLLLEYGASVNYQHGQAICSAIANHSFDICSLLLKLGVTEETLEAAFKSALALEVSERYVYASRVLESGYKGSYVNVALLEAVRETVCDLELIKALLVHGASVHHATNGCLVHAANVRDHRTLELLLEYVYERDAVTYVFTHIVSNGRAWLSVAGLPVIQLLLDNGASGTVVDTALIQVVESFETVPEADSFVDLFLRFQADVDYADGQALKFAVSKGNTTLVQKLVEAGPSEKNMTDAFSDVLHLKLSEDAIFELIEILITYAPELVPEINTSGPGGKGGVRDSAPFTALKNWPRGNKVLGSLLRFGGHVDQTVPYVIDNEYGVEQVSLLLWAFLQPQQKISPYVIDCLLDNGGMYICSALMFTRFFVICSNIVADSKSEFSVYCIPPVALTNRNY